MLSIASSSNDPTMQDAQREVFDFVLKGPTGSLDYSMLDATNNPRRRAYNGQTMPPLLYADLYRMDQQLRSKSEEIRSSEAYQHPETPKSQRMLAEYILDIAERQSIIFRAAPNPDTATAQLRRTMLSSVARVLMELHKVKNGLRSGEKALATGELSV